MFDTMVFFIEEIIQLSYQLFGFSDASYYDTISINKSCWSLFDVFNNVSIYIFVYFLWL